MASLLNKYAQNVTSQHGEDGIIAYLINCIGDKIVKRCCEFGAANGEFASNTWSLWANQSWEAVLIEANVQDYPALDGIAAKNPMVSIIKSMVMPDGENSLDSIFERNNIPAQLGVLSIDIDSVDYYVWAGVKNVESQIVVIEFNQSIPPFIDYVDPPGEVFLRCSIKALEKLGAQKGYRLVCATLTNAIFVAESLYDPQKMPDLPAEALFDWSEIAPILIKLNNDGNKFPVWHKKQRTGFKLVVKLYYWYSAMTHRLQKWCAPNAKVAGHIRKSGLDL